MSPVNYSDGPEQSPDFCSSEENLLQVGDITDDEREPSRLQRPLMFCRLVAKRPKLCFGVTLAIHILFVAVSVALMVDGYDLFPVEFGTLPLNLHNSPWLKRDLAWRGRFDYKNQIQRHLPYEKGQNWPQAHRADKSLLLLYDAGGDNIFTKENLQTIQTIEDSLVNVKQYKDHCQLTEMGTCLPPLSVLRLFDGTLAFLNPVFKDPDFDNIEKVLYAAYTTNSTRGMFLFALGKKHIINSTYAHVTLSRSIIPLGYPKKGMTYFQTMEAATQFMTEYFQPLLNHYLKTKQFTFLYYNEMLMIQDAKLQGYQDMKLAIGSMIFIFGFILFHTRSLWMTCLGVFSIICSFVETNLIYRVIIGYRYFGFFHVLAMFIILGIGADDLFVFWDAWKASELRQFPSLAHRLDETYRKSATSMFVTSLTTMLAFAASAISPLLATNSFGVFSAILVIIDYISVITFFPTIVVFYHVHLEDKRCFWCCFRWCRCRRNQCSTGTAQNDDGANFFAGDVIGIADRQRNQTDNCQLRTSDPDRTKLTEQSVNTNETGENVSTLGNIQLDDGTSFDCSISQHSLSTLGTPESSTAEAAQQDDDVPAIWDSESVSKSTVSSTAGESNQLLRNRTTGKTSPGNTDAYEACDTPEAPKAQPEHRWLVLFFSNYYHRFVTHKVFRWVLIMILLMVVALFAVSVTRLEPDDKQVGLFKESHHYSRAFRLTAQGFSDNSVDLTIQIFLLWGIRQRDLSSCRFSDYKCKGHEVYDDDFDPSTMAAQRSFVTLCDSLFNLTAQQADELRIRRDVVSGQLKINCFARNLNTFLKNNAVSPLTDMSLPWNRTSVENFMASLSTFYNTSHFNASYRHYLDVPVGYWLWDGFRQIDNTDFHTFDTLLGEQATAFTTHIPSVPSVLVGNRLKFVAVSVTTTLRYATLSYTDHIPVVHRWEAFMNSQLNTMPTELKKGFQVAEVAWQWLFVQKCLVDNAVMGVVLGVSLALPILVVATCNVINGLLATLTICCITVCVIGVVPLAGWKLGVLVSLNMCLVVGLAVDYVVHLAEGYHMSHARDRKQRLKQALERMGISVFSGACTTLGASVFMLFAQIQFFYQFGIFMFCTIGFSLLFSMGLYIPVMGIIGPQNNIGDIRIPLRACMAYFRCQKSKQRPSVEDRTSRQNSLELHVDQSDDDNIVL